MEHLQATTTDPRSHLDPPVAETLVVIVTYNAREWLSVCLSPFQEDRETLDILVVDNASTDGTPELIRREYPFVRLVVRPTNLGFGMGNNLGLEYALANGYKGVMLINQDATCTADTIRTLADRCSQDQSIGIASPVHYSDRTQETIEKGFAHYCPTAVGDCFRSVDFINAALWYIPRQALIEVGLFAPFFFQYGEDLDYCHRVRSAGLRVGYFPDLGGAHYRSNGSIPADKRKHLDYVYHLAEFANPLHSPQQRYRYGIVGLVKKALQHRDTFYLRKAQELWSRRHLINHWLSRPRLDPDGLRRALSRTDQAPVLLLVYNRPEHTKRVLADFWRQPEAPETPLYILSDGGTGAEVEEVRKIIRDEARRSPNVTVWLQPTNQGLARNVTDGVGRVLERHDRVIVLEDDLELSPYFLRWMNDCLDTYASCPEIAHIHGGTFYARRGLHPNHLLRFAGSWGWATWRDRWQSLWEPDGLKLLRQLDAMPYSEYKEHFDYGGFQKFSRMLRRQTMGENDSWAIRWHASLLLNDKLSVNAYPPMVNNRGFDGTGVHSANDDRYHTAVCPYPQYATPSAGGTPTEDPEAYRILKRYYARHNNKVAKGLLKIKELWRRFFN